MRRCIAVGLWIVAALAIIDTGISLALTCHEQGYKPGSGQNLVEDCSVFQGPILRFLFWFANAFDKHGEAVIALFTIVLAISTIGLWWSTRKLWEAGEKQIAVAAFAANSSEQSARAAQKAAAIMDQTAERQLRAYIALRKVRMTDVEMLKQPRVKFWIHNVGQTPAYDLIETFLIRYEKHPPGPDFPPPPSIGGQAQISLGPGQEVRVSAITPQPLTEEQMRAIERGSAALYLSGRLDYVDAFRQPRFIEYRYEFTQRCLERGSGRMDFCDEGNRET